MGRLPGYQSVAGNVLRIQDSIQVTENSNSKTFDIGNNNFEYILVYVKHDSYSLPCLGICDIKNQLYLGFGCYNDKRSDDGMVHRYYQAGVVLEDSLYIRYYNGKSTQIAFSMDNGKLTVTGISGAGIYNIDLILF